MEYPDNILRGLSADDWVNDGIVSAAAFQIKFEPAFIKNSCAAQSVCWEDDNTVVGIMLAQKKEGRYQYRLGIARLLRENIEHIMKLPAFKGVLFYEREPLLDNKYHGNLLVRPESTKQQRKLLPGLIASHVSDIIPRQNE